MGDIECGHLGPQDPAKLPCHRGHEDIAGALDGPQLSIQTAVHGAVAGILVSERLVIGGYSGEMCLVDARLSASCSSPAHAQFWRTQLCIRVPWRASHTCFAQARPQRRRSPRATIGKATRSVPEVVRHIKRHSER